MNIARFSPRGVSMSRALRQSIRKGGARPIRLAMRGKAME
jgi:hypothetical protein